MIEFTEEQLNLKGFDFKDAFYVYPQGEPDPDYIKWQFAQFADLKHFYDLDLARNWHRRIGYTASRGNKVIGIRRFWSKDWNVHELPDNKTYDDYECELIWNDTLGERAKFKYAMAEKGDKYPKHVRYELERRFRYVDPRIQVMNECEVTAFFEEYLKYHLQDPSLDPIHNFTDALKVTFILGFSVSVVRESEFSRFGGIVTNKSWLGCPFQDDNVQVCIEHFADKETAYGHGVLIGAMFKLGLIDGLSAQRAWNSIRNVPGLKKQ
jgi:hypothetical protein